MSLVAYADSDCDSDGDNSTAEEINKSAADTSRVDVKSASCKLLLKLPEPKTKEETVIPTDDNATIGEVKVDKTTTSAEQINTAANSIPDKQLDNISLLPTLALPKPKSGGKIQITIPSLSDFNDDDEDYQPKRKMIKPSNSGCGLFSMLPNPKNQKTAKITTNTSMVPRQTTRKVAVPKPPPVSKSAEIKLFEKTPIEVDEEEADDDNEEMDFLGLNKINEVSDAEPVAGFELPEVTSDTSVIEEEKVFGPVYCPEDTRSDVYEDDETKLILDSNALKQLGDRDRNPIKQVDVINVNMSQVMEDSQQWLQKNMTEEYAESRNMGDINVTGQSKRKHQITYLAQQAKANELKLKNMWAENRMTKKQTQAKYGF
ncbi:proline-rich protein PRCC [Adelges cooleyi]|uniref:proline-rich protein PRCC n=1 Tax=Adelges cooleyi TaxID=133065 RepID=UPI002180666D|nr:proline-rich protein PRCC [Adelges cooleyi]